MTVRLDRPTTDLFDSWASAVAEFGDGHIDGSGLTAPVSPDRETLDALIATARRLADTRIAPPEDRVHNDLYWVVEGDEVVGFLSFRHTLNAWLQETGGHIGYAVRASRRRQGIATRALLLGLDRARELGLDRVFLTCDVDNAASARTIERAGGVLQDVSDQTSRGAGVQRRYWIALSDAPGE